MAFFDVLFTDALIVDGTGSPPFMGDVAVAEGRVVAIGRLGKVRSTRVIHVDGRMLCPGFVDMHSHSDIQLLVSPLAEAKVMQGVTTEVIGQDGLSFAPADKRTLESVREQTASWNGDYEGVSWDWSSVAEYLSHFERRTSLNVAYLVPHGTVRILVMGYADRAATAAEMQSMRVHVRQAMAEGAVGLSTGLTYPPHMYADTNELV